MGTLINTLNIGPSNGLFYTVYQGNMTGSGAGGVDNPLFFKQQHCTLRDHQIKV